MSEIEAKVHEKTPAEVKLLGWDWAPFLAGASIDSSVWTVTPSSGLDVVQATTDGVTTSILVGGGEVGERFCLVNRVTTSDDRVEEQTKVIVIV